ncbi:MAG: hypothetical protein NTW87_20110 [Planctomycetota bacterium]|nr:hypothetical protein [Planctomycetota bacterium]
MRTAHKALIQTGFILVFAALFLITIVNSEDAPRRADEPLVSPGTGVPPPSVDNAIAVAPPPFSEGIFPCSDCHEDLKVNTTPRQLTKNHKNIVLKHDEQNRWCLDCHDAKNRDKLHLAGGKLVDFTESYKLCGQCHGPNLRDWKAGEHGKRTGEWSGRKQYLLCANCHNPHAPRYKPLQPLPPPVRPEDLKERYERQ